MSLLDDARRLKDGPFPTDDQGYCDLCDGGPLVADHQEDCPWLSLPKIVAALEAAEVVVATHPEPDYAEMSALRLALKGEEAE